MKWNLLWCGLLASGLIHCGGSADVSSDRDGTRDSLGANEPENPNEDKGPSDAGTPAVDEVVTAEAAPQTSVVTPATTPAVAAPPSTPSSLPPTPAGSGLDEPIPSQPVDPESWLNDSEETSDALPRDAGVGEELRVDDLTLLVVFDNSGSMDTYWDGTTRWVAANRALFQAIEPVKTSLKVGAIRFPLVTSCGVPDFDSGSQIGFNLGDEFLDTWVESALAPAGGTPLAQAFLAVDTAIADAGEMGLLEDRFRVMVVTDGEPNCEGDLALLTELPAKWHERGVETLVLGLPGSSQAAVLLDAIAEAGGTHSHHALGTTEDLDRTVTAAAR